RIDIPAAVAADENAPLAVIATLLDVPAYAIALLVPAVDRRGQRVALRERDAAVDRRPAHHFRLDEMHRPRAHLPDAPVRQVAPGDRRLDDRGQESPVVVIRPLAALTPAP